MKQNVSKNSNDDKMTEKMIAVETMTSVFTKFNKKKDKFSSKKVNYACHEI